MLKLCPREVALPLSLIFKTCIEHGVFPTKWKMANIQPVHKKTVTKANQIIDQSLYYQFAVNFLKKLSLITSMLSLRNKTYSQEINLVLDPAILR